MTTIVALNGQWEGLRALPRPLTTPTHRKRLESGLERLGSLYESMSARAALLAAGMARIDGLRAGMIDQLDVIDGDPDFEPSLSAAVPDLAPWGSQDAWLQGADDEREAVSEDEGAQCDDEGCPDENLEASLSGTLGTFTHAVGPGTTGRGSLGEITFDLEEQCEDEGHDSDREPEEFS